jgi:hypothetical protein
VNRRLSDEQAVLYQEWIANDRRLRSLVDELRRIAREAIELSHDKRTNPMGVVPVAPFARLSQEHP